MLKPTKARFEQEEDRNDEQIPSQQEMLEESNESKGQASSESGSQSKPESAKPGSTDVDVDYDIDFWEPRPPKVLMEDPNKVPLELHSQIQLYATTEYAFFPLF